MPLSKFCELQFTQYLNNVSTSAQQLAKKCGDFFKRLSDYCYEYPKSLTAALTKVQRFNGGSQKNEKSKKIIKERQFKHPKKAVDPNLPKKPLTAYITYFQQHKQRFEQMYPDLPLSDITKLIAKEWKERPQQDKKPYLEKAQNDRKRYQDELGVYQKSKPKNDKNRIQATSQDKKPSKHVQEIVSSSEEDSIQQ